MFLVIPQGTGSAPYVARSSIPAVLQPIPRSWCRPPCWSRNPAPPMVEIYVVNIWLLYMVIIWLMMVNNLVGGWALPLWKIWLRQLGSHKFHVPNHQPAINNAMFTTYQPVQDFATIHSTSGIPSPAISRSFLLKISRKHGTNGNGV